MGNISSKKKLSTKEKELLDIETELYKKYEIMEQMVAELESKAEELKKQEIKLNKIQNESPTNKHIRQQSIDFIDTEFKQSIDTLKQQNNSLRRTRRVSIC